MCLGMLEILGIACNVHLVTAIRHPGIIFLRQTIAPSKPIVGIGLAQASLRTVEASSCVYALPPTHSALFACSLNAGAVPDFCSRSAAHSAAPQVFVYAAKMPRMGTISSRVDATPKLQPIISN